MYSWSNSNTFRPPQNELVRSLIFNILGTQNHTQDLVLTLGAVVAKYEGKEVLKKLGSHNECICVL